MDDKKDTRNTKQKNMIIDCLKENIEKHLTIDELYNMLKLKYEHIGIATVYRNLKTLESQGTIEKVYIAEGVSPCYKLIAKGNEHSHHHLICQECGSIIDFEDDLLEAIEKIIEVTKGFTITDHRVVFYGMCKKCKQVK